MKKEKLVLSLNDFVFGMLNEQQQQSTQDTSSITESSPDWIPVPSRLQQLFLYAIGPYWIALNWYAFRTFKAIKGHSLLAIFNECFIYLSCTCVLFRLVYNKGSWTQSKTTTCCPKCDSKTIEAFKQITGFNDQDIVYCSLRNSVCEIPFFVVLDHAFKSVLILLRGSISANDFAVDLSHPKATERPHAIARALRRLYWPHAGQS